MFPNVKIPKFGVSVYFCFVAGHFIYFDFLVEFFQNLNDFLNNFDYFLQPLRVRFAKIIEFVAVHVQNHHHFAGLIKHGQDNF